MLDHSGQEVAVCSTAIAAGFANSPGDVFARIHVVALPPPVLQRRARTFQLGTVLTSVVDDGNDDMAPFVPLGVVAVVPHDVPADAVVTEVDVRHIARLGVKLAVARLICCYLYDVRAAGHGLQDR